jgi:hypothetical protein
MEEAFSDSEALKAPKNTWESKATRHFAIAGVTFGLFIAGATAAAGGFIKFAIPFIRDTFGQVDSMTTGQLIAERLLLFFEIGLPTAMVVWVLTLFAKISLAEFARANDAIERTSMVETLVLLGTRSTVSEDQRTIGFRALFRPSVVTSVEASSPYAVVEKVIGAANKSGSE